MYRKYRRNVEKKPNGQVDPKRIIFYRGQFILNGIGLVGSCRPIDGVSEGQFSQVLENGEFGV